MFATTLYLAEPGLLPRPLAISGHASKQIGRFFPIRGLPRKHSNLHASP